MDASPLAEGTPHAVPTTEGLTLIGYRGTGKSTVGRHLADWLGRPFADADVVLQERLGRSIRAIFEDEGEPAFREYEQRILAELATRPGLILATGGGAVLREANRRALRAHGTVIWLTADPEAIVRRLQDDRATDRPPLTPAGLLDEVTSVLRDREPLYRGLADAEVATGGLTPAQVAEAVLEAWSVCSRRRSASSMTRSGAEGRA